MMEDTLLSEEQNTAIRDELVTLRAKTLAKLAERSQDGISGAGLLALVANVQTALEALEADREL